MGPSAVRGHQHRFTLGLTSCLCSAEPTHRMGQGLALSRRAENCAYKLRSDVVQDMQGMHVLCVSVVNDVILSTIIFNLHRTKKNEQNKRVWHICTVLFTEKRLC